MLKSATGLSAALSAYILWGLLPIYWKALDSVPPVELLAWRVLGCALCSWMLILIRGRKFDISAFSHRFFGLIFAASLLIGINWGVFLWAVSVGRILQASLGYFITPLINVLLGMVFFSEALKTRRLMALILAFSGLLLMTFSTGAFPWVSLLLACCFGFYSLIVKSISQEFDSIDILAWEMLFLGPLAGLFLLFLAIRGNLIFAGYGFPDAPLLSFTGILTLLPLWLFGVATRQLSLGLVGFLQYTSPTIMFLIGVLVYKEALGIERLIAFVLVVLALGLYSSTLRET